MLLLLSEKDDNVSKKSSNIIRARNNLLEGIMAINSSLPRNAGEIYSNFGENWLDFKTNVEGCCVSSRQCILSGENKIRLLDAACRLQKMISLFNSVFIESKNINSSVDNNDNIRNSSGSGNNDYDAKNTKNIEEDIKKDYRICSSRNLRSRVLIFTGSCARVIPLTAITVRTCLFFGALNQRYVCVYMCKRVCVGVNVCLYACVCNVCVSPSSVPLFHFIFL